MKKRTSSRQNPKPAAKAKRAQQSVTIGIDLGDRNSRYCVLSEEGEILREGQVATNESWDDRDVWLARTGADRDGSGNPFSLGEPLVAEFWAGSDRGQSQAGEADHGEQPKRRSMGRANLGTTGAN